MAEYRIGSHTVYEIKYHFVWITKYRYKVLQGNVAIRLRELLRQGCEARGLEIIKGSIRTCIHNRGMPDGREIFSPDKEISRRRADARQGKLTQDDGKRSAQTVSNGCEYRF